LNKEYKLEKPATVFEDDLNAFKPAFDHSHAKLKKKIDYYYTPYAPILQNKEGKRSIYINAIKDFMRFSEKNCFWQELTGLIIQENPDSLNKFNRMVRNVSLPQNEHK